MSKAPHVADAESSFKVTNISPDFCRVGVKVVPFDISRTLSPEKSGYSSTVLARGEKVLMVASVISGVEGDAGEGIFSGVALGAGTVIMQTGEGTVLVEGRAVCRHGDLCWMNAK